MINFAVAAATFLLLAGGSLVLFRDTGGHRRQRLVTLGFPLLAAANLWLARGQPASALAVGLDAASAALFLWAAATAGRRNFARAYGSHASGGLVQRGPYRRLRHPFYSAYLLFWAGFPASLPQPWPASLAGLATLGVAFLVYDRLARAEEALLRQHYPDYAGYMAASWRFLPLVY